MAIIHDKCAAFEALILSQSKEISELKEKIALLEKRASENQSIDSPTPRKEDYGVEKEQPQINRLNNTMEASNDNRT